MSLKQTAVIIGIAILFTTFAFVLVDAVYPRPEYGDFCENNYPIKPKVYDSNVNCTEDYLQEEQLCYQDNGIPGYDYDEQGCMIFEKCDYCSRDYQNAQDNYSNTLLLILAPIGALAILLGVFYKIEFIGTGFMFSGIFIMFISTVQNFENLNEFTRVIVVFLELLLILFIAYKKVLPDNKKSKKTSKTN